MDLNAIIKKINKSNDNEEWVDLYRISQELNINLYDYDDVNHDQTELKSYWMGRWYCTDTYVGFKIYFLEDKPVAISHQYARKSDEEFEWFNEEDATKVKDYILSLAKNNELSINIVDINKEVGEGFKINFNSQIIDKDNISYNGQKVKIKEYIKESPYGIDRDLIIEFENGKTERVNINNLTFGFRIVD